MDEQSKTYMEDLKKKGAMQRAAAFKQQFDDEKMRQAAAKKDLLAKIEEANASATTLIDEIDKSFFMFFKLF